MKSYLLKELKKNFIQWHHGNTIPMHFTNVEYYATYSAEKLLGQFDTDEEYARALAELEDAYKILFEEGV